MHRASRLWPPASVQLENSFNYKGAEKVKA
jgi:hypothetical protein